MFPVVPIVFAVAAVLPSADRRFAAADGPETPDLQRHVLPLLGRLGCNGRACHGSFQGQGGFRLSLFGYDFAADHAALTGGDDPRTDPADPATSKILRKPTLADPHKGGRRLDPGGWQYNLLLRWVRAGAPAVKSTAVEFAALEVEPREIVFGKAGEVTQLAVTARWADGTREDVTPLCRFRSNDEAVANVDAAGRVTAVAPGDTAVVAFYDNGVAPVQVLLPYSDADGRHVPAPTRIDQLVAAKLRKLGVVPSGLCTDAEFLRRVSIDVTGTLPSSAEVERFLADPAPDKRAKKIDDLLARPAYAAWWATKLCDFTGNGERAGPVGGEERLNKDKARQWHQWVYRRVRDNTPYDELVEGIVLAVGRGPGQSYPDYCAEMSSYFRAERPADFAARGTMPYYWSRRSVNSPEAKGLAFAHSFLGVQLQCAQCHKHPFDQWTKQDFDQFAAFFGGVRYGGGDRTAGREMTKGTPLAGLDEDSGQFKNLFVKLVRDGAVLPFKDVSVPARQTAKGKPAAKSPAGRVITPRLLGGEEVIAANFDDPRQPLMDWVRSPDNPYFARAFVNRVWAGYFNVGLIDPPDDLSLANPPSNPALLDYLADEFVARRYDMKWLHREIATSDTYQRSWRPTMTNRTDERNYSRAVVRRLPAEVAADAVVLATASAGALKKLHADPAGTRAIGAVSGTAEAGYAATLFGKPPRAVACDCERSNEPTLLQAVYLRNDAEVLALLDRPDGWVREMTGPGRTPPPADELVRKAYLRTVGRVPDDREAAAARGHLTSAADPAAGLRDLMWALLNTKEFIVNR